MSQRKQDASGECTCIYCGDVGPSSKEHVLPRCLGTFRGSETLDDRICKKCNEKIGALEEEFCRSYSALFRAIVGVSGRKRKTKVSPFYRGSGGVPAVTVLGKDPASEQDFEVFWEVNPVTHSVKQARQIVVRDEEDICHPVLIPKECIYCNRPLSSSLEQHMEHVKKIEEKQKKARLGNIG